MSCSTVPQSAPPAPGNGWQTMNVVVIAGCLISLIAFGARSSYGLFNDPMTDANHWDRGIFAFALAIQNIAWGIGQPIAGALADRYGPARVLGGGGILYAGGLALTAYSDTSWMLALSAGLMVGFGLSGGSFNTVFTAFSRFLPPERQSWAVGIATSAGSMGQFLFAPMVAAFIAGWGWQDALLILAGCMLALPFISMALTSKGHVPPAASQNADQPAHADLGLMDALRQAFGHSSYRLLVAGFFVCGFQIAFVTIHLPPYLADAGVSTQIAGWAIAVIGLFNVIGSYGAGVLSGKMSKRLLLCLIYLIRGVSIIAFITLPMSVFSLLAFTAVMGLLWLSTVPPTSGLITLMFGPKHLGTLFGIAFFSHQLGAFIGVWAGGILYVKMGSYLPVWWMAVALSLFAAVVHWPIRERAAPPLSVGGRQPQPQPAE